jgi:hypothetical protein
MKEVGKFYGHLVYSYIFGPFGIFCGHFGIFFQFLLCQAKSVNPETNTMPDVLANKMTKKCFAQQVACSYLGNICAFISAN